MRKLHLAVMALLFAMFCAGCKTEVGGITSINEASDAANDPSYVFFPPNAESSNRQIGLSPKDAAPRPQE